MLLKIKRHLFGTVIRDESGKGVYKLTGSALNENKLLTDMDGRLLFSVALIPKSFDRPEKYIFTEYETGNVFYARSDISVVDKNILNSKISIPVLEFSINVESFYGEITVKRKGLTEFQILINGRDKGYITRSRIYCEEIDSVGLLAMIYVFSLYLVNYKNALQAEI